jgi:hypothetical protein
MRDRLVKLFADVGTVVPFSGVRFPYSLPDEIRSNGLFAFGAALLEVDEGQAGPARQSRNGYVERATLEPKDLLLFLSRGLFSYPLLLPSSVSHNLGW